MKKVVYSMCIMKILVINGPNLQLLGRRKAEFYGTGTLKDLEDMLRAVAQELEVGVDFLQSNHEGVLVDAIAAAIGQYDGIVINPAAYTHTSVALRDALEAAIYPAPPVDSYGREINAYYFVSDVTGKTYYAQSNSGHEANKKKAEEVNKLYDEQE